MIKFSQQGWTDYTSWLQDDKKMLKRINQLIQDITRNPYEGLGKPEPLRHNLSGTWSRRINNEHRIVYMIEKEEVYILSVRDHYKK